MAEITAIKVSGTTYDIRDTSKLARTDWTATITRQAWSRVCSVVAGSNTIGGNFMVSFGATRGSVVYNDLFIVEFNHQASGNASITKIAGGNYSAYKIRAVVENSGNSCAIEIYDDADSTTGTQTVNCKLFQLYTGAITTYTTYTAGSVPSGFTAVELRVDTSYGTQIGRNLKVSDNLQTTKINNKTISYEDLTITDSSGTTTYKVLVGS